MTTNRSGLTTDPPKDGAAGDKITKKTAPIAATFQPSQCGYHESLFREPHFYKLLQKAFKFTNEDPKHTVLDSMKLMTMGSVQDFMMVDKEDIQNLECATNEGNQHMPKPTWRTLQLLHSHQPFKKTARIQVKSTPIWTKIPLMISLRRIGNIGGTTLL